MFCILKKKKNNLLRFQNVIQAMQKRTGYFLMISNKEG